jgi:hypothetical protein
MLSANAGMLVQRDNETASSSFESVRRTLLAGLGDFN